MNFREHKDLKAKIISAETQNKLQRQLNEFGNTVDIVDLQYSTHGVSGWNGTNMESWSALILYKEKGDK